MKLTTVFSLFLLALSSSAAPVDKTTTSCEQTLNKFRNHLKTLSPAVQQTIDNLNAHYDEYDKQGLKPEIDEYLGKAKNALEQFPKVTEMTDEQFGSVVADRCSSSQSTPKNRLRRRSLGDDLDPVISLINPTLEAAGKGVQQGAGDVKAAVQNAGATLDQAANGAADVAAAVTAGTGQTASQVPAGVIQTLKAVDKAPGIIGEAERTIFGR